MQRRIWADWSGVRCGRTSEHMDALLRSAKEPQNWKSVDKNKNTPVLLSSSSMNPQILTDQMTDNNNNDHKKQINISVNMTGSNRE